MESSIINQKNLKSSKKKKKNELKRTKNFFFETSNFNIVFVIQPIWTHFLTLHKNSRIFTNEKGFSWFAFFHPSVVMTWTAFLRKYLAASFTPSDGLARSPYIRRTRQLTAFIFSKGISHFSFNYRSKYLLPVINKPTAKESIFWTFPV